ALDYLQWLYDRYGSWYLAAAAYNAGPARLDRVLEQHADGRKGNEDIYWEVLSHLPRETRDYVPRLVAATIVASDAAAFGFDVERAPAYEYEIVFLPGSTRLSTVAETLDVDARVLRDLNPHLVQGMTPPGEIYGVRVPKGGAPMVMASLSQRSVVASAD
ncbi:MAG TPA: transglycosylase SLT domain-containing protein, partial [Longimicrobiales bacterium]|nr:transglycosylase SLT domain-containing protein [Longimicrobiales bacterium]